jgi:multiple sugar transport system permease protein
MMAPSAASKAFWTITTWFLVLVVTFPLIWMIGTAFKPEAEVMATPPSLLTANPTFHNFERVLRETNFAVYFKNSLIVATFTTALVLFVATIGAYAMTSFNLRGREVISKSVLLAYMLPSTAILIPLYLIIANMGLTNTLTGLIVAYTGLNLPFAIWIMRAFMAGIPREIESAALIDGASRIEAFVDVVLPQAVPGIISTGVFAFIMCWNEYLYALVMINRDSNRTLPTGVMASLVTGQSIEWGMVMAAATMMSIPLLLVFLFLQRFVVQGFGAGAVKG